MELSPPLKIPSKHSVSGSLIVCCGGKGCYLYQMGLTLSPIEETKSNTSPVITPTSGKSLPLVILDLIGYLTYVGPADESDDKGSHDQPNTPTEHGWLLW